ncbi:MAG: hypothetical protein Q7S76_02370 [bacterium]|nr:hypothetical protein [bacterium]
MKKEYRSALLLLGLLLWIVGLITGLTFSYYKNTPPSSTYTLGGGFLFDYYQYVSWVKSGIMGNLLLVNRYTEEPHPAAVFNPWFLIAGFMSRPFSLSPFTAYFLFRLTSAIFFITLVFQLVCAVFPKWPQRLLSTVLLITSGSWWWIVNANGTRTLREPIEWSRNFNVVEKFLLAPHHYIALGGLVWILIHVLTRPLTLTRMALSLLIITASAFANPYIVALFDVFFLITGIIALLIRKNDRRRVMSAMALFILFSLPAIGYHAYLSYTQYPWTQMFKMTREFNPGVTIIEYILALGPIVIPSLVAIPLGVFTNTRMLFLVVWAFTPIFLFFLSTSVLPMNHQRVFQSYQYIPLSLLAAFTIERLAVSLRRIGPNAYKLTLGAFCLTSMIYSSYPIMASIKRLKEEIKPNYYNAYVPNPAIHAFAFLDTETDVNSVVLSGEYVSSMIPAFTQNRVILGRGDASLSYLDKREQTFAFVDGRMNEEDARRFLKMYGISHIVFGIDTLEFEGLPNRSFPFLEIVFHEERVTVVRVITELL